MAWLNAQLWWPFRVSSGFVLLYAFVLFVFFLFLGDLGVLCLAFLSILYFFAFVDIEVVYP